MREANVPQMGSITRRVLVSAKPCLGQAGSRRGITWLAGVTPRRRLL